MLFGAHKYSKGGLHATYCFFVNVFMNSNKSNLPFSIITLFTYSHIYRLDLQKWYLCKQMHTYPRKCNNPIPSTEQTFFIRYYGTITIQHIMIGSQATDRLRLPPHVTTLSISHVGTAKCMILKVKVWSSRQWYVHTIFHESPSSHFQVCNSKRRR